MFNRSRQLKEALHDYVAGDLDETAAREVERRVQSDPDVRALLDEVRAAHEALLILRDRPDPPVSADAVLPRIQAEIARGQFTERPRLYLESSSSRFYRRVAMAATLLLAVSVSIILARRGSEPGPAMDATPAATTPSAAERDIMPIDAFVEAGGEMDAAKLFELLERTGIDPEKLRLTPSAVPVAGAVAERR